MRRSDARRVGWLVWGIVLLAMVSGPSFPVDDCPDAWISTKISAHLVAKMGVAAARINPDTEICVVTLRGCVKTGEQRQEALAIARKVKKVEKVIDNLKTCEED